MTRTLLFLAALSFAAAGVCRADDEEPTLLDIKLSDWIKMLEAGKTKAERKKGVIGVEQIGHAKSRKVVQSLAKAVREDADEEVRAAAARAVGRAVAKAYDQAREDKKDELPKFETAREALEAALRLDKSDSVREAAALALGDIGPDARLAAGRLGGELKHKNPAIVRACAVALRRMGKEAKEAQADLQALLANKDGDLEARTEAAVALGLMRDDAAALVPVMKDVVADPKADARLRRVVAEALGKFGKDGADAATALGVVLMSKDAPSELKLAAVTSIDQFGADGKAAISALVKATIDADRSVRCLAMQSLGKLNKELGDHRKEAVKNLLKGVEDGSTEVIVTALETLGTFASEGLAGDADEVVKRLDALIAREGRKSIREVAQAAREKIRPAKKG